MMEHSSRQPRIVDNSDKTAFAIWLGRALKSCHDDAVNEPLPADLLAMLPPAKPQR